MFFVEVLCPLLLKKCQTFVWCIHCRIVYAFSYISDITKSIFRPHRTTLLPGMLLMCALRGYCGVCRKVAGRYIWLQRRSSTEKRVPRHPQASKTNSSCFNWRITWFILLIGNDGAPKAGVCRISSYFSRSIA